MKKLLLAILLFPILNFAQEKISTTDEEYKYLTEGLKIQQETGTDFKSGYQLEKIKEVNSNGFVINYSYLNHIESKKTKAVSIILKKEKDKKDKVFYLCLPLNNAELLKKFILDTDKLGLSMKTHYDLSMAAILSNSIDQLKNK